MPWRLIVFILIFAVFLVFIGFNLENKCDINFGFGLVITDVPVFYTVFVSFTLGLICAIPLVMHIKHQKKKKMIDNLKEKPELIPPDIPAVPPVDEKIKQDAQEAKKRFFSNRRGKK